MEFHGTARVSKIGTLQGPWSSMEFHGTARVIQIGAFRVPWNSLEPFFCYLIEPLASSILRVLNLDRIPWNLSFQILMTIISTFAQWINFHKLISTLYRFSSLFHHLMFYYQYLHYTICISGITHYLSENYSKSLFNAHWNLFWSKSSTELSPEFHGTFRTTLEQHLWFHGT